LADKSLTLVLKARDEASKQIKGMSKELRSALMSAVGPFVAVGAIVTTAAKAAAAGVMLSVANSKRAAAEQTGSIEDALEAQVKLNEGWAEMGRAVPVIGGSIGKIVMALKDTDGLRKQIEHARTLRRELEAAQKQAETWTEMGEKARLAAYGKDTGGLEAKKRLQAIAQEIEKTQMRITGDETRILNSRDKNEIALARKRIERETETLNQLKGARRDFGLAEAVREGKLRKEGKKAEDDFWGRSKKDRQGPSGLETAADRKRLEEEIFAVGASARDREMRAIETQRAELIQKYMKDAQMRVLIEEAAEAKRRAIAQDTNKENIRKQNQAWEKEKAQHEAAATEKAAMERQVFDLTHNERERAMRDLQDYVAKQRERFKDEQEALKVLFKLEHLRSEEIKKQFEERDKAKRAGAAAADFGFTSRMAAYIPSQLKQEPVPRWALNITSAIKQGNRNALEASDALPRRIAEAQGKNFRKLGP